MRPQTLHLLIAATFLAGCSPPSNRLVVSTDWPAEACERFEREHPSQWKVVWIRVLPGDDPAKVIDRGGRVDMILGGSLLSHRRLESDGRLAEWRAIPQPWEEEVSPGRRFDDRRSAPSLMHSEDWPATYAGLVLAASKELPIKPEARAVAGVGVVAGSAHEAEATAWLRSFPASEMPATAAKSSPQAESLAADLLGCVLIESHEELRAARRVLDVENSPKSAEALMTEPPPWPPASIARMKTRPDGEALIATLAEQVAPDRASRAWLVSSWGRDPAPLSGATLEEIARAAGGRLATEPRFRSWLRTEWTAWARQRYRRVAVRAGAGDLP